MATQIVIHVVRQSQPAALIPFNEPFRTVVPIAA